MKTSRTDEIIREIAVKHGVSCEEVTSALAAAIDYGRASTDPRARLFWKSIGSEGDDIILEDFLKKLALLSTIRIGDRN